VPMLAVEQTTLAGLEPEPTLEDLLVRAWGELRSRQIAECPLCRGEMEPEYGAQALPIGGRCTDCGAVLR
jgi:hypothetical protein